MPVLTVSPEEIAERLDRVPNIPEIIKDYSIKENSFRVELKIERIPMDIVINLTYHTYSAGMILFTYSCNIPKIFLNLLKGIIKDRTNGVITIEDEHIKMNANQLLIGQGLRVGINKIIFDHGFYKIDFSL